MLTSRKMVGYSGYSSVAAFFSATASCSEVALCSALTNDSVDPPVESMVESSLMSNKSMDGIHAEGIARISKQNVT